MKIAMGIEIVLCYLGGFVSLGISLGYLMFSSKSFENVAMIIISALAAAFVLFTAVKFTINWKAGKYD